MTTAAAVDPLDLLATLAASLGAETAANDSQAGDGAAKPADLTNTQCLAMAVEIVRETLCSFAKVQSPKTTMSNEVMAPVAEALGAVFDKYGISLSGVAGDYMTEIKAAIVAVPVLLSIRSGLQAEVAASKKLTDLPAANDPVNLDDASTGQG